MIIRKHFYFSGRVQGVGFRFQACRLARSLGLTGYVRNLSDGRVELEAQGEEYAVDRLTVMLNQQPYLRIDDIEATRIPVRDRENGFHW